jgi:hypothetical protein
MGVALQQIVPSKGSIPCSYSVDTYDAIGEIGKVPNYFSFIGKSADLAHLGTLALDVLEIELAVGAAGAGSMILGALTMFVGGPLAVGEAYAEGVEYHARKYARSGFSRGAAMAADGKAKLIASFYGNDYIPPLGQPAAHKAAKAAYVVGLLVGARQALDLTEQQRTMFWRDLGNRMGDQSWRGKPGSWSHRDLVSWYTDAAAELSKDHLS